MNSFSVIVTAHNCAATIRPALDSVQEALAYFERHPTRVRDVKPEVIVVDDGSTDSTHQLALEFARDNPVWKVVHRAYPSSPGCARNTGASQARGELLFFLD